MALLSLDPRFDFTTYAIQVCYFVYPYLKLHINLLEVGENKRRQTIAMLLAVLNDQTRPPIKTQKEEKLTILNTYTFTIDLVPHVFKEYCFTGHKHKCMETFTERHFPTLICAKE